MDILQSVMHRLNLLESTHANLSEDQQRIKYDTNILDEKISRELFLLKQETKSMLEECNHIHKMVFEIGSLLQEKITKQELESFDKQVQEWNVETFITTQELPSTFEKYAKQ